ncbi:MAG: SPOR domain-containing protein [Thalassotalea sp.]|nr:SPOR domain-containing protein [Thalassotalea sp.]
MKNLTILLCASVLLPFAVSAQDTHKVGAGFNYHLDQENGPGYHIFYQWQFGESFEFETRYFDNNDIVLQSNEADVFANYDQFSIGANFIKRYNSDLSIKAGTGLGFITASSNEAVTEKQTMAPYIMLAATYKLTKDLSIEFGQFTHFNSELIDTNHSLFLSLSYQFGQSYNYSPEAKSPTPALRTTTNESPSQVRPTVSPQVVKNTTQKMSVSKSYSANKPLWYVQFGAYSNAKNGQESLMRLQQAYPNIVFNLVNYNNYYRIISHNFDSKQRAEDYVNMLMSNFSLSG